MSGLDPFVEAADGFERAAQRLEAALRHLRAAARHAREGDVPRMCAHAFAAEGNLHAAEREVRARAVAHAGRSAP